MRQEITIFGGGIVGVMSAYYALKAGYSVLLVEKNHSCGHGASFQNGGQLSFSHIFSVCDINIFKYFAHNIFTSNTPINISYLEVIKNFSWCFNFLQHSLKDSNNFDDLFKLAYDSHKAFNELTEEIDDLNIDKVGTIQIFRNEASFTKVQNIINYFDKYHFNHQVISEKDLQDLIPIYKQNNNRAIYFKDDKCVNTYKLINQLINYLKQNKRFKFLTNQNIQKLEFDNDKISFIKTSNAEITPENIILTPGSYIDNFSNYLKLNLPIAPLKGYSFNNKDIKINNCLIDHDKKIVYSPLNDKVRVSGLYDFAGFNDKIKDKRITYIKSNLESLLSLKTKNIKSSDYWCGFRPITTDKMPIIGNSKIFSNLHYNIGHANLGLTLSAGSSKITIDALANDQINIPVKFKADRFNI